MTQATDEPMAPLDFDEKALPASVRAELRGVPADTAHIIEGHLVAAAELLDEDPAQANAHAQAARRRAPRLPVLREVAAEAAYQAGEYASALNDYRALRRMTGNDNFLPVMADCERALGRPQAALRLIREGQEADLTPAQQVELVLVQAGARRDLDQKAEAVRLLREAVKLLLRRLRACTTPTPRPCSRKATPPVRGSGSCRPRVTIRPISWTARTASTSLMARSRARTLTTRTTWFSSRWTTTRRRISE